MGIVKKLEADVEMNVTAKEFHDIYSCRPHHISNMSPANVQAVYLHQGEWGKEGAIICWNYTHDRICKIAKEIIEVIDNVNLSTTFKVIEGDGLKEYKSFKFIYEATPMEKGSLVHWTLEYEKMKEDSPDPNTILEALVYCSKDIDAHLTKP